MIDNIEVNEVMELLESIEKRDEKLARELLLKFNNCSKKYGTLLLSRDKELAHEDWKSQSDEALKNLQSVISDIKKEGESL